jgi:glycosyltransferase involved in cell wall biosynthesis
MNILIIAYEFPPLNSGGSHRPFKFAKLLPKYGIHPIVITPELSALEGTNLDPGQLQNLEHPIEIIRTPVKKLAAWQEKMASNYYFNIEDTSAKKWEPFLIEAIEKILTERDISVIYVTAPPFSMANLGRRISKRFNLPFLLDMRDAWSHWVITPYPSYLHYRLTLIQERKALEAASAVIAVTDQMISDFQQIHPKISKEKYYLITNAYDETPPQYPQKMSIAKASAEKPLRIGYVGSFYYSPYQRDLIFKPWWKKKPHQYLQYSPRKEDWLYRSPYFFFKALAALIEQRPETAKLLKVDFVGTVPSWLNAMVEEFKLQDIVSFLGVLPHKKALQFQDDCDALLLTSVKVLGGLDYCIAGKTYEYICRKKPILAVLSEGNQKRFIEATGLGILCSPDDTMASVQILQNLLGGDIVLKPQQDFIESVNIEAITEKLANIIKNIKG